MSNIDLAKRLAAKEDSVTFTNNPEMTRLINLTPHAVSIHHFGTITIVEPSGSVARVAVRTWAVRTAWDAVSQRQCIPLVRSDYGSVEGLPAPEKNTIYIVSTMVRSRVPSRADVASPSVLVRDASGAVIGCSALEINYI